jgi:hypothetical protein
MLALAAAFAKPQAAAALAPSLTGPAAPRRAARAAVEKLAGAGSFPNHSKCLRMRALNTSISITVMTTMMTMVAVSAY